MKRIIGVIIIIVGIIAIVFSNYIKNQVAEGKVKIKKGEKTVGAMDTLFSQSETTETLGKPLTSSAKKKIAAGKEDVQKYTMIGNLFLAGGIVVIIVGLGLVFIGPKKH